MLLIVTFFLFIMNTSFLHQQGSQKGEIWLCVEIGMQLLHDRLSSCRIDDFLITFRCKDCRSLQCVTLSRIFQVVSKWFASSKMQGPLTAQLQKKCSFWNKCVYSVFHFLLFCPIQTFICYVSYTELCFGKKDSSSTRCGTWQTLCRLQRRIKWRLGSGLYIFVLGVVKWQVGTSHF